jgi:Tfp pilus assembly protein FimT
MHRPKRIIRSRTAFTLVELVTVIGLIGIISVVAASATMSYLSEIRSRAAAARLTSDIRYAQRTALASRLRSWVAFDVPGNTYRIYLEDAANLGKANRQPLTLPLNQSSGAVQFGAAPLSGVVIVSAAINGTSEIEFDSFGVPYDGNSAALTTNGVVTLSNGVTITLRPVTGFVDRAG